MEEVNVVGDGNCMFRSVAVFFHRDERKHLHVRSRCIHELRSHPSVYKPYISGETWKRYLTRMSTNMTWGDQIVLSAIATSYGANVMVHDIQSKNVYPTPPQRGIRARYDIHLVRRNQHYTVIIKL